MAKPTKIPIWNTGGANNTEPSAGEKVTGWSVGQVPPSSYFNWLSKLVGEWLTWLDAIENEALDWQAEQTFTGSAIGYDGNGLFGLRAWALQASSSAAIVAQASSLAGAKPGVYATSVTGRAVQAIGLGAGATGVYGSGDAAGVHATSSGTTALLAEGDGALVQGAQITANGGVATADITNNGTGRALSAVAVAGDAIYAAGPSGGTSKAGLRADTGAAANTAAVVAECGHSGPSAVYASKTTGTGATEAAVYAYAGASAGQALIAHSANTARSALRVVPQASTPAAASEGDIWIDSSGGTTYFKIYINGGWKTVTVT